MTVTVSTDIALCHSLRRAVFIEEQGVSDADERDGLDKQAIHFLAWDKGVAVGTARVLVKEPSTAKIGRVCILPAARGTGLGQALIRAALDWARQEGLERAELGAQMHALAFYEALGFAAYGPIYDDAGIDHRDMEQAL